MAEDSETAMLPAEAAGETESERLMIMTTVNNAKDFEKIATALREQHSKIHIEETNQNHGDESGSSRHERGRGGPARRPSWRPRPAAFAGRGEFDEPGPANDNHEAEPEDDEPDAYEAIALDVVAAYHEAGYDPEVAENWGDEDYDEIAYTAQTEQTAYCSQEKARAAGLRTGAYVTRFQPSELTLQEKKRKVQLVKARSKCRGCGKVGHWQGDRECPKNSGTGGATSGATSSGQPQRPTPFRSGGPGGKGPGGKPTGTRTAFLAIDEEELDTIETTAFMVVRSPEAETKPKAKPKAKGQPVPPNLPS